MTPRKKVSESGRSGRGAVQATAAHPDGTAKKHGKGNGAGKPGLSRGSIVAAALAIIDREGYEALSMRRLGKELGVNPMAVYYHIPSKSALLDALVEVVMNEIDLALDEPSRPVEERLFTAARAYRDALLARPSLIHAVAFRPPRTIAALRPVEVLYGIFFDAGFKPEDALAAVNIFATYVRGSVTREAPYWFNLPDSEVVEDIYDYSELSKMLDPKEFPNLTQAGCEMGFLGFEAEFDRGARALIRGLLEMYGKKQEVRKNA